jgi:hypothetical protein
MHASERVLRTMTANAGKMYRSKALECRRQAHSTLDRAARRQWLAKAVDYDRLANRVEFGNTADPIPAVLIRYRDHN